MKLDLEGIKELSFDCRGGTSFFAVVFDDGHTVLTDVPFLNRPLADVIQSARAHKHEMDEIGRRSRVEAGGE